MPQQPPVDILIGSSPPQNASKESANATSPVHASPRDALYDITHTLTTITWQELALNFGSSTIENTQNLIYSLQKKGAVTKREYQFHIQERISKETLH